MSFEEKNPIGSEGWFKGESQVSSRGTIATCIQLLQQGEISFAKCMELVAICVHPFDKKINWESGVKAPWDKLDWNA